MIDDRVRIAETRIDPYRLGLLRPWRTARGELAHREGWVLRFMDEDGQTACGECAPMPEAGTESFDAAGAGLEAWCDRIRGLSLADVWRSVDEDEITPAVRCAVEAAAITLAARRRGLPVARLLNPEAGGKVAVNAAIGAADNTLIHRIREASQRGFRVLKVKVGVGDAGEELGLLQGVAARLPPEISFRLDANGAWDERVARSFLEGLAGLPVESVEEPLAGADPEGLLRLARVAPFPLALDESLPRLIADGWSTRLPAQRIVVKPMVLGGIRPAMRLARKSGRTVIVTTTLEAAPGRWIVAQLAAALDTGLCHGLDTGGWLAEDVSEGPTVESGICRVFA